jgi:lipopolysaccharide biosynthesis glycosyltransferase
MKLTGENRQLGEKPVLVHFVHHKSHMDLTWNRTRASVVRGRRLTA